MTIFLKFPVGHATEGQKILKLLNLKNKGKSMPWSISEIHPLLVHFPIALFSTGLLFDISSYVLEKDELETAGFYTMFMGLISSFFAIISGMIKFFEMGSISDIFNTNPGYHGLIQLSATIFLSILFGVRIKYDVDIRFDGMKKNIYFLLYSLSVGILFYGAHLGAKAAERI